MPNSMTAFSRYQMSSAQGEVVWELRSVNHRYLEPNFRLPEGTRHLEAQLRGKLKTTLARGKVDCNLQLNTDALQRGFIVDDSALERLCEALAHVAARSGANQPFNAVDLLRWPGILSEPGIDTDELEQMVMTAFDQALSKLQEGRAREGADLGTMLITRIDAIEALLVQLRQDLPTLQAAQESRLHERLAELNIDVDQQRLEQELVYLAQRADVSEELDRLASHLTEVRRTIEKPAPCGRRLDFIMQELNREANTLGSKSNAGTISNSAIETKVLIEQMREQVQNIE